MTITLKVSISPTSVSFQVGVHSEHLGKGTPPFKELSPKKTVSLNISNFDHKLSRWEKLNEHLTQKVPLKLIPLHEFPSRALLRLIKKHFDQSDMKSEIEVIKICFAQSTINFHGKCIIPSKEMNTLPEIIAALKTLQAKAYPKDINLEAFRSLETGQHSPQEANDIWRVGLQPAIQAFLTEKEAKQLSPEERCNLQNPQIATLVIRGMLTIEVAKNILPLYRERLEKDLTQNDLSESNLLHITNTILGPAYASLIPLIKTKKLSLNEAITCPPGKDMFRRKNINHLTALLDGGIISFLFLREALQADHERKETAYDACLERLNNRQILRKVLDRELSLYLCDLPWLQPALNNGKISLDWAKNLTVDDRRFLINFQHSIEEKHLSVENVLSIIRSKPADFAKKDIETVLALLKEEYPSDFDEAIKPYYKKRTSSPEGIGALSKNSDLYINHPATFNLMKKYEHTSIMSFEAVNHFKQNKITFHELVKIALPYANICTHSNTSTANGNTQTNQQHFRFFSTTQEGNLSDDAKRREANRALYKVLYGDSK